MGRVAVLTGVSSGVGECLARLLVAEGCHVVGISRSQPKLVAELPEDRFDWHCADLSRPEAVEELCRSLLAKYDKIDVLIHCAGASRFSHFRELDAEDTKGLINLNFTAPALLTRYLLKKMGQGGQIVFVTSSAAIVASPMVAVYAAAKAAQESLARSLSIECSSSGILIKVVRPGPIRTDFHRKAGAPTDEKPMSSQSAEQVAQAIQGILKAKKRVQRSGFVALATDYLEWICPPVTDMLVRRRYLRRQKRALQRKLG